MCKSFIYYNLISYYWIKITKRVKKMQKCGCFYIMYFRFPVLNVCFWKWFWHCSLNEIPGENFTYIQESCSYCGVRVVDVQREKKKTVKCLWWYWWTVLIRLQMFHLNPGGSCLECDICVFSVVSGWDTLGKKDFESLRVFSWLNK